MDPAAASSSWGSTIMLFAFLAIFLLITIVPQRKAQKRRDAMLNAIKAGDKIVTVGRVYGRVVSVENGGKDLIIDIANQGSPRTEIKIDVDGIAYVVPGNDENNAK